MRVAIHADACAKQSYHAIDTAYNSVVLSSRMPKTEPDESKKFWVVGAAYLIRTVTMIDTGVLVSMDDHEIILKDAAWIADTGRFHAALKPGGKFSEVEPFPDGLVAIGRGSIIDAVRISDAPRIVL